MSQAHPKPNWETRLGLGLIGGLLAVLAYVAWQKIDSLFASPEAIAESAAPLEPAEKASERQPPPRSNIDQREALGDAAGRSSARIIGLREVKPDEQLEEEPLQTPPAFDTPPDEGEIAAVEFDAEEHAPNSELVTEEGDSFWRIAERAYGDGAWYKALYAHNRERFPFPDRVAAGEAIDAPAIETLRELYPELCPEDREPSPPIARLTAEEPVASTPDEAYSERAVDRFGGRTHMVRQGETLAEIAEAALGDRSRWTEIYRLNRSRLGDKIESPRAGLVLVLPETTRIADGDSIPRIADGDSILQNSTRKNGDRRQ